MALPPHLSSAKTEVGRPGPSGGARAADDRSDPRRGPDPLNPIPASFRHDALGARAPRRTHPGRSQSP